MTSSWFVHWRNVLAPPKDLYRPLFEQRLIEEQGNFIAESLCVHRYTGPHEIGVTCREAIGNPVRQRGRVAFDVIWTKTSGEIVLELSGQTELSRPWYSGPNENGFSLVRYEVPENVPLRQPLHCQVKLRDVDGALATYGPEQAYARNVTRT